VVREVDAARSNWSKLVELKQQGRVGDGSWERLGVGAGGTSSVDFLFTFKNNYFNRF
jgi:hypothetical protein